MLASCQSSCVHFPSLQAWPLVLAGSPSPLGCSPASLWSPLLESKTLWFAFAACAHQRWQGLSPCCARHPGGGFASLDRGIFGDASIANKTTIYLPCIYYHWSQGGLCRCTAKLRLISHKINGAGRDSSRSLWVDGGHVCHPAAWEQLQCPPKVSRESAHAQKRSEGLFCEL